MNKVIAISIICYALALAMLDNRLTRMENMMDAAIAGAVRE